MFNRLIHFLILTDFKLRRKQIKKEYKRILSFGDYYSDRWDKAKFSNFGKGTSVYDNVLILGDVRVGDHCWIGPNCILDGTGGSLHIGDNCSISAGVHIYTHQTVQWALADGEMNYEQQPVYIGSKNYIGPNSVISMGSKIGDSCVIGALTFVNGITVPSGSKVYGSPGKVMGLTDSFFEKN